MTQSARQKNLLEGAANFVKDNKAALLCVGITFLGVFIGSKVLGKRMHPDIKKVIELRSLIQKSYINALQSLQTLNIQKRVFTEYGSENNSDEQQELNMLFLVISRLKLKQKNKQKQLRNPFLPPFQDGLFISELEPSHRLLYNKFNIFTNHLLVVTKEFEAQGNQLNEADFRQSFVVLKALEGLLFFNSGPDSGSSQPHKHVQIFPKEALELPIVKKILQFSKSRAKTYDFETQGIIEFPGFNFVHGMVLLRPEISISASKKKLHDAYKRIMKEKVYRIKAKAYNIIGNEEFIMIVARSKEKAFDEIPINAVGFMGSLLFKEEDKLNKYLSLKIKPSSILEDITYPREYEPPQIQRAYEKKQQAQKAE